ncbi:MAG: HTTM domain-containing protein, partial [Bacteroidota bacterium]
AGIAKLKYDWLIKAEPMKTWLSARTDFPLIGSFFNDAWVAYVFSWGGMLYDLSITFFLLSANTRPWAYVAVWGFHVMTWLLFPIGMFPWIMIAATLIFFTEEDWKKVGLIKDSAVTRITSTSFSLSAWQAALLGLYICMQVWLPLRHYAHPGNVLWNERGLRFAWHVMVMEKNGMTSYHIQDQNSGKDWIVYPSEYLIPAQERQMSFQPDMIKQFGEFLIGEWEQKGYPNIAVTVKNRVCVNKSCKSFSWENLESIHMEE